MNYDIMFIFFIFHICIFTKRKYVPLSIYIEYHIYRDFKPNKSVGWGI